MSGEYSVEAAVAPRPFSLAAASPPLTTTLLAMSGVSDASAAPQGRFAAAAAPSSSAGSLAAPLLGVALVAGVAFMAGRHQQQLRAFAASTTSRARDAPLDAPLEQEYEAYERYGPITSHPNLG